MTIVLIIFHYFFEDPSPYIFTSSWKISSKSITYCLSYFDFRHIFDPCDLDLWRLSVIIELVRARIFLHHPTKWRQNRSITFWDILITRAWQTNGWTDRQTKWKQYLLSPYDGGNETSFCWNCINWGLGWRRGKVTDYWSKIQVMEGPISVGRDSSLSILGFRLHYQTVFWTKLWTEI